MIRRLVLLSMLALGTVVTSARAGEDFVIDRHRPWSTQARDYCAQNPISMRTLTAQVLSIARCASDFDTGEVKFHQRRGRTIAEWPVRGRVTQRIIAYCSCMVHD